MIKYIIIVLVLVGPCLGATTYYIDYNAADNTANGTTKLTPWKCAPIQYYGAGTTCTAVHAPYTPVAGDTFIFKGNVTWPSTTLPFATTLTGTPSTSCYVNPADTGCYRLTVDQTWFTGGVYGPPVIDGEFADIHTHASNARNMLFWHKGKHFVVDGFEFKNFITNTTASAMFWFDATNGGDDLVIQNSHLHDIKAQSWSTDLCSTSCFNTTGGLDAIVVYTLGTPTNPVLLNNDEIENESMNVLVAGTNSGTCNNPYSPGNISKQSGQPIFGGATIVGGSLHGWAQVLSSGNWSLNGTEFYNDGQDGSANTIYPYDWYNSCGAAGKTHPDLIFPLNNSTTTGVYIHNSGNAGMEIWFPNVCWSKNPSTTASLTNSLIVFNALTKPLNLDSINCNNSTVLGNIVVANNTLIGTTGNVLKTTPRGTNVFTNGDFRNNYIVSDLSSANDPICLANSSGVSGTGCGAQVSFMGTLTYTSLAGHQNSVLGNNLWQSSSQGATGCGGSGCFNATTWVPLSTSAPTYNVGSDTSAIGVTTDKLGVTRPQAAVFDIGAYEFFASASSYAVVVAGAGNANGTICSDGTTCTDGIINAVSTAGVTSGTSSHTFTAGATVTLTATATTGAFAGFSGGGCSTSPCTVTVNSPLTISATFQTPVTCSLTFAANSLNAPSLASATTTISGLSGPGSFWFIFGPAPDNTPIYNCSYPFSGCTANGQTGNIIPVGSGLYTGGACSNGVCCTGSTAPLNINTGAGSAAH